MCLRRSLGYNIDNILIVIAFAPPTHSTLCKVDIHWKSQIYMHKLYITTYAWNLEMTNV